MPEQYDDLDAYIAKRTTQNPAFPAMVDAALKERRLLRELAAKRVEMGLSQKIVAALMGTTQPALARLERGEVDPKLREASLSGREILPLRCAQGYGSLAQDDTPGFGR